MITRKQMAVLLDTPRSSEAIIDIYLADIRHQLFRAMDATGKPGTRSRGLLAVKRLDALRAELKVTS